MTHVGQRTLWVPDITSGQWDIMRALGERYGLRMACQGARDGVLITVWLYPASCDDDPSEAAQARFLAWLEEVMDPADEETEARGLAALSLAMPVGEA